MNLVRLLRDCDGHRGIKIEIERGKHRKLGGGGGGTHPTINVGNKVEL